MLLVPSKYWNHLHLLRHPCDCNQNRISSVKLMILKVRPPIKAKFLNYWTHSFFFLNSHPHLSVSISHADKHTGLKNPFPVIFLITIPLIYWPKTLLLLKKKKLHRDRELPLPILLWLHRRARASRKELTVYFLFITQIDDNVNPLAGCSGYWFFLTWH